MKAWPLLHRRSVSCVLCSPIVSTTVAKAARGWEQPNNAYRASGSCTSHLRKNGGDLQTFIRCTYTCPHTHTYIHTYINTYMQTHKHTHTHKMHTCIHLNTCVVNFSWAFQLYQYSIMYMAFHITNVGKIHMHLF